MEQHRVDPPRPAIGMNRPCYIAFDALIHKAMRRTYFFSALLMPLRLAIIPRIRRCLINESQQYFDAVFFNGHGWNNSKTDIARESFNINRDAARFGDINHIERNDHRCAGRFEFKGEAQTQTQIRRINDADNEIGPWLINHLARNRTPRHCFVRATAAETIGTRQIHGDHFAA